ncbi:hypothetical protein PoB_003235100 [Plakobranchus ocellatus]|uniref:Uncharacterized protein n=1 Tax=Plakobranchus ocellatus TaxID=259542 RepID=A0AAV4A3K8_9GAST|nr:hypothetical protein PoB_003235100 [Plakobranchus ocellatus]
METKIGYNGEICKADRILAFVSRRGESPSSGGEENTFIRPDLVRRRGESLSSGGEENHPREIQLVRRAGKSPTSVSEKITTDRKRGESPLSGQDRHARRKIAFPGRLESYSRRVKVVRQRGEIALFRQRRDSALSGGEENCAHEADKKIGFVGRRGESPSLDGEENYSRQVYSRIGP